MANLAALRNDITLKEEERKKIQDGITAVNEANAAFKEVNKDNSFNYVADNMDAYWNIGESSGTVLETIKTNLRAIAKEFNEGSIVSAVDGVLAASQKKITEIDSELAELNAQYQAALSEVSKTDVSTVEMLEQ